MPEGTDFQNRSQAWGDEKLSVLIFAQENFKLKLFLALGNNTIAGNCMVHRLWIINQELYVTRS